MKWFLGLFSPSLNFRAYFNFSQAHIYQFDHLQMFITGLKCPFCDYFFFFLFLLYLLSFIIIISVFSKSPSVLLCVFFSYVSSSGTLISMSFAIGIALFGALGYYIQPWRNLASAANTTGVIFFLFSVYVPQHGPKNRSTYFVL